MTVGIKYISDGAASGYGLAGFAYIRALHNASVPVWPFFFGPRLSPGSPGKGRAILPLGRAAEDDANLADLPALMRATARPIAYDTIVVHSIPELWRRFTEAGTRLIGYTVWETDALPEHWPGLLNAAEAILVPSRFNAKLFARGGVTRPVHVVPHIRRHAWSESARDDGVALRLRMGIPADHFVFYTISVWDPRKAVGELIDAFAREFRAEERVTLLVKTSAAVDHAAVEGQPGATSVQELTSRIVAQATSETGHRAPNVLCIAADDLTGRALDAVHATGDAYISLTHGEGWGLGAFDAATLGKPLIITGWGGQLDYLGDDYPGLVRYEMIPVKGWLPHARYRATRRWASADRRHAAQLMRAAVARDSVLLEAAASVREVIATRFAESVVAQQFLAAIGG
jgi:glycosyltransferase involved in cell wall biosynthesis